MSDTVLTHTQIEELKQEFTRRWPDAAKAFLNKGSHIGFTAQLCLIEACLWHGFKEGYKFGIEKGRE